VAQQALAFPEDPEQLVEAQIQFHWAMACTGKFVWPIPDKELKKRIHRIAAPTLLVWGKQDRLVPPVYAEAFASRISNTYVELIDQAGHIPPLEKFAQIWTLILWQAEPDVIGARSWTFGYRMILHSQTLL